MQSIQLIIDMFVDMYKLSYVVNILGILIASAMGFIIFWFGVKYGVNMLWPMIQGDTRLAGFIRNTGWYQRRVENRINRNYKLMMENQNDYFSESEDFGTDDEDFWDE